MDDTIRVLFMQSQRYFGSDSTLHAMLMRTYDRSRIEVHAACEVGTPQNPSASYAALRQIPNLRLRPVHFGPTLTAMSKSAVARSVATEGPLAARDLTSLAWYIKQHKIDVIHGTEKPRDAFYGVLLAKLTGAKSVVHLHVACADWQRPVVLWALGQADAIIGVSQFVANSAIAKGYAAEKVHAVVNSIDASGWDYTADGSAIRREFDVAPDTCLIAITSRLFHWKGHTQLLQALAKIQADAPAYKLLIVGEDDLRAVPGSGSYTAELKQLVGELGIGDHVVFTGFRRDVRQILAAADIYALPSYEEPAAVAFLEAMAMKKPIIALNNGGTPELVEDGVTGLLSEAYDVDQLAANLLTLLRDPALRKRMGDAGRERVEHYLNPQRMAADAEQVYRAILGRPARVLTPEPVH